MLKIRPIRFSKEFFMAVRASVCKNDEVGTFLAMFDKVPLLSRDEEAALARRVRQGDGEARWRFICANVGLVVDLAKKYRDRLYFTTFSEALYDGLLGLLRAVADFDPEKGNRFSTYAFWWIKNGIFHAMENGDRDESFDALLTNEEDGSEAHSGIDRDDGFLSEMDDIDFRMDFQRALSMLEPLEAAVFCLHCGFGGIGAHSFSEIARKVGLNSKQRANQIYARAKRKLEQPALARLYADYLDPNYDGGEFLLAA